MSGLVSCSSTAVSRPASAVACFASASPLPRRAARAPISSTCWRVSRTSRMVACVSESRSRIALSRSCCAFRSAAVAVTAGWGFRSIGCVYVLSPTVSRTEYAPGATFGGFFVPLVEDGLRHERRLHDPQVPHEAVDARLRGERLVLVLAQLFLRGLLLEVLGHRRLLVRVGAQQRVAVEELEQDRGLRAGGVLQPVIDDDARRDVLSFPVRALPPRHAPSTSMRTVGRGVNRCAGAAITSAPTAAAPSGRRGSRTRGPASPRPGPRRLTVRSVIGTTGRLSWNGCQLRAVVERDVEPVSVPA